MAGRTAPRRSWWRRWKEQVLRPRVSGAGLRTLTSAAGALPHVRWAITAGVGPCVAGCSHPSFSPPLAPHWLPCLAVLGKEETNVMRLQVGGMTCSSCAGTGARGMAGRRRAH